MTGARSKYHYNSYGLAYEGMQNPSNVPCAEIGKFLAKELDVEERDYVYVENENGKLMLPVHICDMADDTVHIAVGGGSSFHMSPWREINANSLCDLDQRDELSGFITCKSVGCNIYKNRKEIKKL